MQPSVRGAARLTALMESKNNTSKIIFLGTGTSEGVPRVSCLVKVVRFITSHMYQHSCKVCTDSVKQGSTNRRRNTSIMIQYFNADSNM